MEAVLVGIVPLFIIRFKYVDNSIVNIDLNGIQGEVSVTSLSKRKKKADHVGVDGDKTESEQQSSIVMDETVNVSPFLFLSLDIPPAPLFKVSSVRLDLVKSICLYHLFKGLRRRACYSTNSIV